MSEQHKQMMAHAGATPELMAKVEAGGLDWSAVWAIASSLATQMPWTDVWPAVQKMVTIIVDTSETTPQKLLACLKVIADLFAKKPSPISAP